MRTIKSTKPRTPENFYRILVDKVPSCQYRREWGQSTDKTCVVISNYARVDGGTSEGIKAGGEKPQGII